ncbi:hypothetical protein Q73_09725 [Bacillus coahuilensis m2-6]|uniref:hypothetical protein n=1 Tax=Bacillus coahuilensis TaxID=408580 RepID=UPI000750298C|nr:hypothetical protein [Bacillus coahuilensis]KUP07249.1 hypothetical protein Q73_09725 [Bacillus coahuilensis m2-6]
MKRRRPEAHLPLGAGAGQRKAEAARSGPTRVVGASRKALFAFWEVTTTLEGLAAGAGQRKAEAARSGPTRVVGASRKALFAFWEVTTTLEGLAAGAGHDEKRKHPGRGVWTGGLGIEIKEYNKNSTNRAFNLFFRIELLLFRAYSYLIRSIRYPIRAFNSQPTFPTPLPPQNQLL